MNNLNIMEVTGKLVELLPIQTGEGKNGSVWKKQDIILEIGGTDANVSKKLCVGVWNDKINYDLVEGTTLKVSFEIDSKEYNNRWYTNLWAREVEGVSEMLLMNVA
jgi:hypothetical protein